MNITMTTEYLGELRTSGTHLRSGEKIVTDAPVDNNGKGEAYSPTDLVAAALASCMITIMGMAARRENIDISGLKAGIEKIMSAEPPRRIVEIRVQFTMPEHVKMNEKQKELLKHAAHTCPVARSLHSDIRQVVEFNF
jgi:putative redox protein